MADSDCIFCRIVAGEVPCHRVYEDEDVLVFMDLFPAARGHTLVVPRAHHESIFEISDEAVRAVASAARRVARAIGVALGPDGLNVTQASGAAAGQTVPHYHVHLLPRSQGQRLSFHGTERGDPEELAALAQAIAGELDTTG
jgi:histidine triad (HIT) family protein